MVDLRSKPAQFRDEEVPDDRLPPPSPELMQRLRERFAAGNFMGDNEGTGMDGMANAYFNLACYRGATVVIEFLQSIITSQENN